MARRKTGRRPSAAARGESGWYLLIHQLPPEPLYLRAKIRQRLARVGAVALKNAVYALPRLDDCLEDFEWIAQEAIAGGGDAHVCEARFLEKRTDDALVERFRAERRTDYAELADSVRNPPAAEGPAAVLGRARKRLEEIARIDFFAATGRAEVERQLEKLQRSVDSAGRGEGDGASSKRAALAGRTWVTRKGIKVDRISSAWLIRRFLDANARLRFIDPSGEAPRPGEISFDMVGGDFTHEADRCTFETLLRQTATRDAALTPIAEIVHDIDLKDGKFGRPETRGIERLLSGILRASSTDEERLERGFALFDGLYESFRRRAPASKKPASKKGARK